MPRLGKGNNIFLNTWKVLSFRSICSVWDLRGSLLDHVISCEQNLHVSWCRGISTSSKIRVYYLQNSLLHLFILLPEYWSFLTCRAKMEFEDTITRTAQFKKIKKFVTLAVFVPESHTFHEKKQKNQLISKNWLLKKFWRPTNYIKILISVTPSAISINNSGSFVWLLQVVGYRTNVTNSQ